MKKIIWSSISFAAIIFLIFFSFFILSQTSFAQSTSCKVRSNSIAPQISYFKISGGVSQLKLGGCLVNFSFKVYDPDDCYWSNRCLTAEINFGDEQTYTRVLGCESWTIPHIYKKEGQFTATLKVCDPSGKCAQKEISQLNFGVPQPRTTEPAGPSGTPEPSDPYSTVSGQSLDQTIILCNPAPKISQSSNPPSTFLTPSIPSKPNEPPLPTLPQIPSTPKPPSQPNPPPSTPNPPQSPQPPIQTPPDNGSTFDILFVPLNYQDTANDKKQFQVESDKFKNRILNMYPFSEFKDKINFSYMEPKDCQLKCQSPKNSDNPNEVLYTPCIAKLVQCTKNVDKNKVDKILGIIKYQTINPEVVINQSTGLKGAFFAQAISIPGQYTVIYPIENYVDIYKKRNTGLHEIGHLFGLYHILVEKIENGKDVCSAALLKGLGEGKYCVGPNASDCNDPKKDTDILSYCLIRDHYGPAGASQIKKEIQKLIK